MSDDPKIGPRFVVACSADKNPMKGPNEIIWKGDNSVEMAIIVETERAKRPMGQYLHVVHAILFGGSVETFPCTGEPEGQANG